MEDADRELKANGSAPPLPSQLHALCLCPRLALACLRHQIARAHRRRNLTWYGHKIILWVTQSLLHYDTAESRTEVLKFFLNTAQARSFISG